MAEVIVLPDKIVGFAFADDYNDKQGMYRFTAEMELYVDSAHYMKGIAKCLADKLVALLDPDYLERRGYLIVGEELEAAEPSRIIKNIILNVPYDKAEVLEWKARWLENWLGCVRVGTLRDIGNKIGNRCVSTFVTKMTLTD